MSDPNNPIERKDPVPASPPLGGDTRIGQSSDSWIDVPKEELDNLGAWLYEAINRSTDSKADLDDKLVVWEKQYESIPEHAKKDFPWKDASNLVVPITASHVEAVLARLMGSLFSIDNLWVGKPKSADWVPLIEPMEKWINWVGKDVMDMYDLCQRWFIGMLKFGTGIVKLPWERIIRYIKYKDQTGALHEETVTRHEGPRPQVVPLSDFYVTPDAYAILDIQNCEGVFQRCIHTKKSLEERKNSGIFRNIDKVLANVRGSLTTMEEQKDRQTNINRTDRTGEYETWECWVSYDIGIEGEDGKLVKSGELSELLVDYHMDSRTILRAIYNPYRHQERPFHFIRFMPREGSIWGIGLCQMLQDIQTEITAEHNLRVDNASISNASAFKVKRNAHFGEVDIYPGAYIPFDDVDDIQPLQIGASHDTLLREELHTTSIGERRTGVSDYTVGRESAAIGSRATATSTLALIREGNKRFLMTINDIRKSLRNLAHQVIMLYQQFAKDNKVMYEIFSEEEKMWVKRFFELPAELTRANVVIDVVALSEAENKDAQKQGLLTLMTMMGSFFQQIFQAVSMAVNPQVPPALKELASEAAKAGTEMWKRILEAFEFRDPATFSPNMDNILMMASAMEVMNGGGQGAIAGAAPSPGGVSGGPPMGPSVPETPGSPGAGTPAMPGLG